MNNVNSYTKRNSEFERVLREKNIKKLEDSIGDIIYFDKSPSDIKSYLDNYIIGQDDAKKVISTAISYHYKRISNYIKDEVISKNGNFFKALNSIKGPKSNILVIGPTGCGKTYTAQKCSDFLKVPFVVEDMTKFSETGYVGRDLSEIIEDVIISANGNQYIAHLGIVYLDEIDKIASSNVVGRDVSGLGVQNGLLKIVEGSEINLRARDGYISFSTKNILFIASGAFEGIEEIVVNRLIRQRIEQKKDWKEYLSTSDLVTYGIQTQLAGRFPIRTFYNNLTEDDLFNIMRKSNDSPIIAYKENLYSWGIDLNFTDSALRLIAKFAEKENIGARGLTTIINKVLIDPMYYLPDEARENKNLITFNVDDSYVLSALDISDNYPNIYLY